MSSPTRTPEIAELRTFCTAADLGSLGRAALRLGVSQPALSKRLQSLEQLAGARLLERSSRGVKLTPEGRRLYEEARRLLEQADAVSGVLAGLGRAAGPVRLAASHSATDAVVGDVLARLNDEHDVPVELVTANSQVVRGLVGDGRADLGVAAGRPAATPNPGVRELPLASDQVVCAVPRGHLWAQRRHVSMAEFLRTPMVMRDPSSNARWTVDAVLRERGLTAAEPLVQTPTPAIARREALARNAPLLLSEHVLGDGYFVPVEIESLSFPRQYELVLPELGDPAANVRAVIECLRSAVAAW